jgi:hypothetical protein
MSEITTREQKKEDWMNNKWRPMMGWMYMLVCTMDFVAFPILWSIVQVIGGGRVETQWSPITLQGAGLFHMAMGAILGIAAFGRTQEKLAGANNGGLSTPTSGSTAPSTSSSGFGTATGGFGSSTPTTSGFSGSGFGGTPTTPSTPGFTSNTGFGATTPPAVTANGKAIVPAGPQPEL